MSKSKVEAKKPTVRKRKKSDVVPGQNIEAGEDESTHDEEAVVHVTPPLSANPASFHIKGLGTVLPTGEESVKGYPVVIDQDGNRFEVSQLPTAPVSATPKPRLSIQDACSKAGCIQPPVVNGLCVAHASEALSQGHSVAVEAGQPVSTTQVPKVAQRAAQAPSQAASATISKSAQQDAQFLAALKARTSAVMGTLRTKGWSDKLIGSAMRIDPGTVWNWRNGTACKRVAELEALLALDVPVVEKKPKASKPPTHPTGGGTPVSAPAAAQQPASAVGSMVELTAQVQHLLQQLASMQRADPKRAGELETAPVAAKKAQ